MNELSKDELIFHLVRVGAKGNSIPAKDVQLLTLNQIRRYRKSGRIEEADNLLKALMESGYDPQLAALRDGKDES